MARHSLNYGYDEFSRLTSLTTNTGTPVQNFSWVYDVYGNRWQQNITAGTGPTSSLSFNTGTNRINTTGYLYDAAGNMTNDTFHTYTYDAEGNITAVDNGNTGSYVYDALNHKVRAQLPTDNVTWEFVFDASGHVTSHWTAPTSAVEGHIYWDNSQLAYRAGDGNTYFVHRDWVDTDRVHTDPTGAAAATYTSFAFGDDGSITGTNPYATWDFATFGDMDITRNQIRSMRSSDNTLQHRAVGCLPIPITAATTPAIPRA